MKEAGKAPIGTRWVIVNKGDDNNPECRARLVAKELKCKGGAIGYEALVFSAVGDPAMFKMLLSLLMTRKVSRFGRILKI